MQKVLEVFRGVTNMSHSDGWQEVNGSFWKDYEQLSRKIITGGFSPAKPKEDHNSYPSFLDQKESHFH